MAGEAPFDDFDSCLETRSIATDCVLPSTGTSGLLDYYLLLAPLATLTSAATVDYDGFLFTAVAGF